MSAPTFSCIPGPESQHHFTSTERSAKTKMAGSGNKYYSCMQVLPLKDENLMGQGVPNTNWIPDPHDFKDVTPLVGFRLLLRLLDHLLTL